jgi:integrase
MARKRSGAGSVYWHTAQKRYIGEITLGRDERGIRVKKVFHGPRGDKSDDARLGVKDSLEQFRGKQPAPSRGRRATIANIALGEYLDDWLTARDPDGLPAVAKSAELTERKRLSAAAYAAYRWAVDEYIIPVLGKTRLRDLERAPLRRFLNGLNLGDASKEKIRTALQAALYDAATSDHPLISVNPAVRLDFERRQTAKEIAAWTPDEAKKFLRVAKNSPHFPLFLLALVGALGPAELFGIQWKSVDLKRGSVAIVANLTEVSGRLVFKETKTKSRRRSVAIPDVVLAALKQRHKSVKPEPTDFVFTPPEGGGWHRTNFRKRVWLPLVKKAKVPAITLYGLRHSSASLMAAMGVPLLVASRALGHSNIRTTANTYTHLFEETQREVANKFGEFLRDL